MSHDPHVIPSLMHRLNEIFFTYFKLGYTTFGGPAAHIAILYDDIVVKRNWISSERFTELFAICQALPGPASTELAYSLALVRSGLFCAIFAFLLWSMPGAIVMTVVGTLIGNVKGDIPLWATRLEQGLASAAIGLVALAAYRMSTTLATDKLTRVLALLAGSISALFTAPWLLPVIMIAGGIVSFVFDGYLTPAWNKWKSARNAKKEQANKAATESTPRASADEKDLERGHTTVTNTTTVSSTPSDSAAERISEQTNESQPLPGSVEKQTSHESTRSSEELPKSDSNADDQPLDPTSTEDRPLFTYSRKSGLLALAIFLVLLVASILVRALTPNSTTASYGQLVSTFYVVGSIIFGGGPVIIPLLKTYTVDSGWMSDQQFLVGLALIQSLPGPNFNIACFLGAVSMANAGNGKSAVVGAILGFLGIFFPGLVLKNAIIPFWQYFRGHPSVKMIFRGVNACALGLVFSATWLLWTQTDAIGGSSDYHVVIASTAFVASGYLDIPAPLVIILGGGMGAIEYAVDR